MGKLIRQPILITTPDVVPNRVSFVAEKIMAEPKVDEVLLEEHASQHNELSSTLVDEASVQTKQVQIDAEFEQARLQGHEHGFEQGFELGQQEGYQAGLSKSEQDVQKKWQSKQDQLGQLLSSIKQERQQAITKVTDEFVPVVFSALTKIIGDMAVSADLVQAVVQQALHNVRNTEEVTIKIHSQDIPLLKVDELTTGYPLNIHVVADDSIQAGCIIETNCGDIDARLDVQLVQFKQLLSEVRSA